MQESIVDLDWQRAGAVAGRVLLVGMLAFGSGTAPALAEGEQFETLILNRGRTFVGRIIDANRNTVAIRNEAGVAEIMRADDIQTVFIPAKNPEDRPFFGSFVDWQDGVYQLNINFQLVRVKDGVMLGEPLPVAPPGPAPNAVARGEALAPDTPPPASPALSAVAPATASTTEE